MTAATSKELSTKIEAAEFKPLFKTRPLVHLGDILYNWILIFVTIYVYLQLQTIGWYILAVIVIGARMHALAILMHDASHFRFLKNRKWNDLVTNYLTMYPIFTSIETYRQNHLRHHQHLNTDHDPDWVAKLGNRAFTFPKSKTEFLLTLGSYLVLYQGIMDAIWFLKRFGGGDKSKSPNAESKPLKLLFYIVFFGSITYFGVWKYFLLFWIVPYFSTFFMIQYIRSVAEHFGELAYEDSFTSSRTVKCNLIEQFFIAPHNVGYHLEHHLYPGVPYYHLPKLHKLLMKEKEYQSKAHITIGYTTGLMQELGKVHIH